MGIKSGVSKAVLGTLKVVQGRHQQVLNAAEHDPEGLDQELPATPRTCEDISRDLQKSLLSIKSDYMSDEGGRVDHAALVNSDAFHRTKVILAELRTADVGTLASETERRAFFINLYNALVINKLAVTPKLKAMSDDKLVWTLTAYNVGGDIYSLDDIEHGILRCNVVHPVSGIRSIPNAKDPRRKYVLDTLDPRLHFALNCGAQSCPRISVYSSEKLDKQLTSAAKSFCSQEVVVTDKTVTLSKILDWYQRDFGETVPERLRLFSQWVKDDVRDALVALAADEEASKGSVKVDYRPYKWEVNTQSKD